MRGIFRLTPVLVLLALPRGILASTTDPYAEINATWERFGAVYSRILENYYTDLDHDQIMRAAIDGMLRELDPYSQFYDEEGLRQLRQDTTGKFAGLGITVGIKDHHPVIISPIEDTPASRAGLLPGDLIVAIEGKDTFGLSLEEVVEALRGEPGSSVRIRVARQGGPPDWDLEIERELIKLKSVTLAAEIHPGVGYISLRKTRFSEDTSGEVEEALKRLKDKNIKALILDLRGNPGGLLSEATRVSDLFLPKDLPIVSIREREGRREETRFSQRAPQAGDLPLVVLIDEGSASASEIVAGAIQDNDRGVIVGEDSFGKGSVQTIFDLHETEHSALKLTTALYYTPSGRSIHRKALNAPGTLLLRVPLGHRQLPALAVLDLIMRASDSAQALTRLQMRFDLEETQASQLLSLSLADLLGSAAQRATAGTDTMNERKVFKTLRGRKVYGGGGIAPDIHVEQTHPPAYIADLERRQVFFDFVVDYVAQDSVLAAHPEKLEVDDAMVGAFEAFVRQSDTSSVVLPRAGGRELAELGRLAVEMGWGEKVRTYIDSLERAIETERTLTPELEGYIRAELKRELVLRLRGRRASLLSVLQEDPQVLQAVELLEDSRRYEHLLEEGAS